MTKRKKTRAYRKGMAVRGMRNDWKVGRAALLKLAGDYGDSFALTVIANVVSEMGYDDLAKTIHEVAEYERGGHAPENPRGRRHVAGLRRWVYRVVVYVETTERLPQAHGRWDNWTRAVESWFRHALAGHGGITVDDVEEVSGP